MARRFSVEAVFKGVDRVTAPVSRMQQRLQRFTRAARRGLESVNRVTGKVAAGMRRGLAVIGIAAAGVALSLNSVAAEADSLAKQGRRLDVGVEALQEWRFIAEQSGVSGEKFSKSLEALSKRLGEARAGTGSLYTFLKRTDTQLLQQLQSTSDTEEALQLMVQAMRDAEDPMRRNALAAAAFSRQGIALTNIADNSADAIAALRREARENGLILQQQAHDAEAYNDAVNSLSRAWRGFMTGVLLPLTPMLTDLVRELRVWMNLNREIVASEILEWVDRLIANFQTVLKWVKRIGIAIGVFIAFQAVLKSLIAVLTVVNLLMAANPVVLITLAIIALIAALAALVYWWDSVKTAMIGYARALHEWFAGLPEVVQLAIATLAGPIGWFTYAAAKIIEHWDPLKKFFVGLFDSIVEGVRSKIDWLMRQIERVKNAAASVGRFFGIGDEEADEAERRARSAGDNAPVVVSSPQERTARSIEERRSTADLTIRDETGRAEFRQRGQAPGIGFSVVPTGSFAQ